MLIQSRKQNAFTLIELLIVIAIIAVLIGLLFPAISKIYELANMTVCTNNMRQMGLAMNGYEAAKKKLPVAGEYLDPLTKGTRHTTHSFFTHILPFMEKGNTAKRINMRVPYNHPNNINALKGVVVTSFICPVNPARSDNIDPGGWGCVDYGTLPYTNINPQTGAAKSPVRAHRAEGALGHWKGRRKSDISDGLSNTIALYEDVGRSWVMSKSRYLDPITNGPRSFWRWAEPDNASGLSGPINNCRPNLSGETADCPWSTVHDTGHNNEPFSFHAGGGANMLFCDGSVRWVDETIDTLTLRAWATYNGGERISGEY